MSKHVDAYRAAIGGLADNLEDLLPARARAEVRRRRKRFETAKVPRRLSQQISALDYLACCGDIVRIGRAADEEFERVGKIYFLLGERLGLDRIRRWAAKADPKSRWRRQVAKAMGLDLFHHQADLTRWAVSEAARRPRSAVEGFLARHPQAIERLAGLVGELRPNVKPDVALLSLLEREVRRICGGW